MADVDKSLPNVRQNITIPSQEEQTEVVAEMQESMPSPDNTEITENPDGSVDVDFDPGAAAPSQGNEHYSNLAAILPDSILQPLGSELFGNYTDYKESRREWERSYSKGLDLLGFQFEQRTQPFQGASGATHPVLAEAVTQFQAQAYKELLPADGPIRTQILGASTPEKEAQSQRVRDFMNYEIMNVMKEYEPEFDQMLFYLPLAGSTFKKVYYDDLLGRAVSKFVPADDLVVPYTATSLEDAEAICHTIKISENDLRKQQVAGFYRDIEIFAPYAEETEVKKKERELEGTEMNGQQKNNKMYTLIEVHTDLDLEGFEDRAPDGMPTGIKVPYIITVDSGSRKVLSIRRNYKVDDPKKRKIDYFVHFKFLPGLGFYGFGLIH